MIENSRFYDFTLCLGMRCCSKILFGIPYKTTDRTPTSTYVLQYRYALGTLRCLSTIIGLQSFCLKSWSYTKEKQNKTDPEKAQRGHDTESIQRDSNCDGPVSLDSKTDRNCRCAAMGHDNCADVLITQEINGREMRSAKHVQHICSLKNHY